MPAATHRPSRNVAARPGGTVVNVLACSFASLLVGTAVWLYLGTVVAVIQPGPPPSPEFVLFLPPAQVLALAALVCGAILVALSWWSRRPVGALWPVALLGFPIGAAVLLATPARAYAPAWIYLFFDLRWCLAAGAGILLVAELVPQRPHSAPRTSGLPPTAVQLALVAGLMMTGLLSAPAERFEGHTNGDEPKYLRFDENWYRGRGLDIADLSDIKEVAPGTTPALLANVRPLVSALGGIVRDMAADVEHRAGWAAAPPRATSGSNQFVVGKRGGLYQVHNPGISLLLLPGYTIDRYFNTTNRFHPQFPTYLYATNVTLMLLYALWGLVLFRGLVRDTSERWLALAVTVVLMTSLPAVAFTYQYYPEVAAGVMATVVAVHVMRLTTDSALRAFAYGAAAGYLPWLHLRFGLVPFAATGAYWANRRATPRTVAWFGIGAAVPLAAMALYNYHIAGNVMPWALWNLLSDSPGFNVQRMTNDLPRIWSDRGSGLIAHAPFYLLAAPGLIPLWRKDRSTFLTIALFIIPVAMLSAAHSFSAGGTTPGRYMAAVLPLLAWPILEALTVWRRSAWSATLAVLLAVLSSVNGLTYNLHFIRPYSELRTSLISGWTTTLWFAPKVVAAWGSVDAVQMLWWTITLVLILMPLAWTPSVEPLRHTRRGLAIAATIGAIATYSSVLGAWTGRTFDRRYLVADTRRQALAAHLSRTRGLVWSGARGVMSAADVFPSASAPSLSAGPDQAIAGVPFDLELSLRGNDGSGAWGVATVRFADDNTVARLPLIDTANVRHTFATAGSYRVFVAVEAGESQHLERAMMVRVSPR